MKTKHNMRIASAAVATAALTLATTAGAALRPCPQHNEDALEGAYAQAVSPQPSAVAPRQRGTSGEVPGTFPGAARGVGTGAGGGGTVGGGGTTGNSSGGPPTDADAGRRLPTDAGRNTSGVNTEADGAGGLNSDASGTPSQVDQGSMLGRGIGGTDNVGGEAGGMNTGPVGPSGAGLQNTGASSIPGAPGAGTGGAGPGTGTGSGTGSGGGL